MNGWGNIAFGVRCGGKVDPQFFQCWTKLILEAKRDGDRAILPVIELPHHFSANTLIDSLLMTNCDSLLFVDDDMVFSPNDLDKLRDDEDGFNYDMLQGLCLSRNYPHRPLIMEPWENGQFKINTIPQVNTIVDVAYCGLAFTLCRRSIIEKVAVNKPSDEMFFHWGEKGDSEDSVFSAKIRAVGGKLGVNTKVCIGHRVPVVIRWNHEHHGVAYEETRTGASMEAYGTHRPILEKLIEGAAIKTVLEFGTGNFSTDFFIDKVEHLTSIEQQRHNYFQQYEKKFGDRKDFDLKCMMGPGLGADWLRDYDGQFDLIFVDGDAVGRPLAINQAFNKTSIIVAHDTESGIYDWESVEVPEGWQVIEFKEKVPWTTVWTNNSEVVELLNKREE